MNKTQLQHFFTRLNEIRLNKISAWHDANPRVNDVISNDELLGEFVKGNYKIKHKIPDTGYPLKLEDVCDFTLRREREKQYKAWMQRLVEYTARCDKRVKDIKDKFALSCGDDASLLKALNDFSEAELCPAT